MTTALLYERRANRIEATNELNGHCDEVTDLENHVRAKLTNRLFGFQIEIGDAGLVLRGKAPTYYVKSLAQHAVMERTRIPIAINRISVPYPARFS